MGLFNFGKKKNADVEEDQTPQQPGNPTTMIMFRVLAIGYVLWIVKDLFVAYFAGGEDAPSLTMLLVASVLLVGGCVAIGIMSYGQWKRMKQLEKEYREEMARIAEEEARLEAEKAALEEEYPDDGEYYEEEEELLEEEEETEETAE